LHCEALLTTFLQDVLTMIRNTSNPQVEYIVRIIKKWCKENNVKIT
jgi:intraflagellar transport protein 56